MNHFFAFLAANFNVVGWSGLLGLATKITWQVSRFLTKLELSKQRSDKAVETIDLLATNHLPHVQAAIENVEKSVDRTREEISSELRGLRSDLLQIALNKKE